LSAFESRTSLADRERARSLLLPITRLAREENEEPSRLDLESVGMARASRNIDTTLPSKLAATKSFEPTMLEKRTTNTTTPLLAALAKGAIVKSKM
jgi:hypothetical protein